ncbi:MAG: hypothetical protein ACRD16_01065 [Thermoanaerobaculia bacterium]
MKNSVPFRVLTVVVACLLSAPLAFGGFAGTETYLAAVGNPQGAGGAQFYSDVWITDVDSGPVTFTFQFLQSGQANPTPAFFQDTLSPGQTKKYTDVVGTQLHLTNVNGAARILSTGELFVAERIYNQPAAVPLSQTAGQFFSGVPKGFSIALGQSATLQGVYLGAGLDFRYNYVLVETSGSACTVHVQALDDQGIQLGATDIPLLAFEHLLLPASVLAPAASTGNARLEATVTAGSGTVLFAGSQVGNGGPQDQSGFEMSFRGALLGSAGVTSLNGLVGAVTLSPGTNVTFGGSGNNIIINAAGGGGGGLASVTHDGTMIGNGTGGSSLGVAAPLTLANGETTASLAGSQIGVFASTTDSVVSPFSPAIFGTAKVTGVYGEATNGSGAQGWGELGRFFNSHYFGVLGFTFDSAAGGAAIYGDQNLGSGVVPSFASGVWGDSRDGVGVYGSSSFTTSGSGAIYGVYGTGVVGVTGNGTLATTGSPTVSYGLQGVALTAGQTRAGVFGFASGGTTNYAGLFAGDVSINGTVHTSSTVVKLDDPLAPETKYLYHAVVESPDMMNIYNGMAVLDPRGEALVNLPAWFESLNREFRYQLTAVGAPGRDIYISQEVQNNQFRIGGGTPGLKVSWQVTGIRHDAYSVKNPITVEVEKPAGEQGLYLHPEAFGQPIEKGVDYRKLSATVSEKDLQRIREQSQGLEKK